MKIKKIILSILVCLITLTSFSSNCNAYSIGDSVYVSAGGISWWVKSNNSSSTGVKLYVGGSDNVGFCIEQGKDWISGSGTLVSSETLGLAQAQVGWLSLLAYYGYYSDPTNDKYFLTQNLIWSELGGVSSKMYVTTTSAYNTYAKQASWQAEILAKATAFQSLPSFNHDTINVNIGDTFTITDTNGALSTMSISDQTSNLSVVHSGNTLTITVNSYSKESYVDFERKDVDMVGDALFCYQGSSIQNTAVLKGYDPTVSALNINITPTAEVTVTKVDTDTQQAISDEAGFKVYDSSDTLLSDNGTSIFYTDSSGQLTLPFDLEAGTYYLEEVQSPSGYILDSTKIAFTISDSEASTGIKSVTVSNKKNAFGFMKVDEKNDPLNGALFTIWKVNEDTGEQEVYLEDVTTDEEGNFLLEGLAPGTYILEETKAPEGYVLLEHTYTIVVDSNGLINGLEEFSIVVPNDPFYLDLTVNKLDSETLEPIMSDFEFTLYSDEECSEVLQVITSDSTGFAEFNKLRTGTYYLKETKAPEGYVLSDEVRVVEVLEEYIGIDKTTMEIDFINEKILTSIEVNKIDSITQMPVLSNDFEFTMYADIDCTEVIDVVNANIENGTATFENVGYGTYYIKETNAPIGYMLSDEVKEVIVDDLLEGVGDIHSFVYMNSLLPAIKTGDSQNVLFWNVSTLVSLFCIALFSDRHYLATLLSSE